MKTTKHNRARTYESMGFNKEILAKEECMEIIYGLISIASVLVFAFTLMFEN